jgi:hypothetical protein
MKLNANTFTLPVPAVYYNVDEELYRAVGLFIRSEAEAETLKDPLENEEVEMVSNDEITRTLIVTHLEAPIVHPILDDGRILHEAFIDDPMDETSDILVGFQGGETELTNRGVQYALGLELGDDADAVDFRLNTLRVTLQKRYGITLRQERKVSYAVFARAYVDRDTKTMNVVSDPVSDIQFFKYRYEGPGKDFDEIARDILQLVKNLIYVLNDLASPEETHVITVNLVGGPGAEGEHVRIQEEYGPGKD